MPNIKEIILPEHNSSRILFINNSCLNNGDVNLEIRDTTDDEHCTETSDYAYNNSWLLGKLNNYMWLLEDVGEYDLNHEHKADIYYIDPNTNQEVVLYHIRRVMEYGEECDRLYMQYGGGMKLLLTDVQNDNMTANLYIKYERNLAGCYEEVGQTTQDGKDVNYIIFYKYSGKQIGIAEVISIVNELNVTTDEVDGSGNPIPMTGLNYCIANINNVSIDFSQISINFLLSENNTNDVKVGMIGINSINKKFISYKIVNNCIEPSYFLLQTPNKRSWICYRTCYNTNFGVYYNNRTMPNDTIVGFLNREGSGLNGYYGTYDNINNQYVYEINISKNDPFNFMIPKMFTDWASIEWKDNNGNTIRYFDGLTPFDFFNDLDGLYYKIYSFPINSRIHKIIIRYNI